ncbi:class I SAM-dependent methyltransferase [Candidatus Daviesbacteria bacterium]|nr:class I SAM-dependent methyltransferase [Candidatus Daviesbacteria bacterium]
MQTKAKHWDSMYELPLETIPWEISQPPVELVELIDKRIVLPGTVLELGSGTGNYSIYLAKKGFQVTGKEFSKKALEIAQKRVKAYDLKVKFIEGDVLNLRNLLKEKFDFIFDYSLLHHIPHHKINSYAKQFRKLLKKSGKLLLICYSEKDELARGKDKVKGKYGNLMYYRTAGQIRGSYKDFKEIYYRKAKLGKRLQHLGHCFLFENPL